VQVEFSPLAYADLEIIGDHIARDSPANALSFVNRLIDRCLDIALAPEGYVERPELGKHVRSVAFQDYLIFYSALAKTIRIERIIHGSRDYLSTGFF